MGLSRPGNSISQPAVTVPGAGGGGTDSQGVTATAGSDVATTSDADQALSGGGSNGTAPYTFAWTVQTQPSGASASITSASSQNATLTGISASKSGAYVCKVVATDSNGFTDSATVTISVDRGPSWRTVLDLDLSSLTAGALTMNGTSASTVDGHTYYIRAMNASNQSYTITGNGLECDFGSTSANQNRVEIKIGHLLTATPDGYRPKIRISGAFESLVTLNTGDYIGCGFSEMWVDNNNGYTPRAFCKYRDSGANLVYYFQADKGNWGSSASGALASGSVSSDGNGSSGVLVLQDAGGGAWQARGHDGDSTPVTAGTADTFRAMGNISGWNVFTTDRWVYRADSSSSSWDGPYLCLFMKSNNNSSAVTWTRLIVEEMI